MGGAGFHLYLQGFGFRLQVSGMKPRSRRLQAKQLLIGSAEQPRTELEIFARHSLTRSAREAAEYVKAQTPILSSPSALCTVATMVGQASCYAWTFTALLPLE